MKYTKTQLKKPYIDGINPYLTHGWENVLPLPPKSKFAPPKGFTGIDGKTPDEDDIVSFISKGGNIALRLPDTIIGLDIDSYGDKVGQSTLEQYSKTLGQLPPTWTSSRHENLLNGRTMLFRVPAGTKFISGLKDIDIIQSTHRYLTAPPSIHPTGAPYYWYSPSGHKVERLIVPEIDDISDLPKAWLEFLTEKEVEQYNHKKVDGVKAWNSDLAWLPQGSCCQWERGHIYHYEKQLRNASSRHDVCVKAVMTMFYSAADGHTGIKFALEGLRNIFIPMIALDRGIKEAEFEFDNIVTWCNTQVRSNREGRTKNYDPCKSYDISFEKPDITAPEPRKKAQGKVYGNVTRA